MDLHMLAKEGWVPATATGGAVMGAVSLSSGWLPRLHAQTNISRPIRSVPDAVRHFWAQREALLDSYVQQLYREHLAVDPLQTESVSVLANSFRKVPPDWPRPESVTWKEIVQSELDLLEKRLTEGCSHSIVHAWKQPMELHKLVPLPVAVLVAFSQRCGYSSSYLLGWLLTFGGWNVHCELHAVMNKRKPEFLTRPRVLTCLISESNSGKTPFFEDFVLPTFVDSSSKLALVSQHEELYATANSPKGFMFKNGSQADFAERMHVSCGRTFWCTEATWRTWLVGTENAGWKLAFYVLSMCGIQRE